MSKKTILGYWDVRGYGHPIRFMLAYMKVDYEDKIHPNSADKTAIWFQEKFTLGLDFPNVPYLIDGEVKMTETVAIIKYLARKYDPSLIPEENVLWQAEMLETVIFDIWRMLSNAFYNLEPSGLDTQAAQKLKQLDTFIGNKEFLIGKKPHYVDFFAYECLFHYKVFDNKRFIEPLSSVKAFMKNFEKLPQIVEYMNGKNYKKWPCFSTLVQNNTGPLFEPV